MSNSRKKRRDAYWASLLSWEDVYQLPLHPDKHGSYAWSANGTMALMFEYEEVSDSERKEIIDCINGTSEDCPFKGQWQLRYAVDFFVGDCYMFCVRGWGHLTGTGALHLHYKKAEEIQDAFVKYILKRLNGVSDE